MNHYLPPAVAAQARQAAADEALNVARRRGLPIPPTIVHAAEVLDAVQAVVDGPTTPDAPVLPDRPAAVAKAVAKVAAERSQREQAHALALEWQPVARDRLYGAVARAVPDWVAPTVRLFDSALDELRNAIYKAPRVEAANLGALDPHSFGLWQAAQTACHVVEGCVYDRRVLASSLGENFTSSTFGDTLALVAVITPPEARAADADRLIGEARGRRIYFDEMTGKAHRPAMTGHGSTEAGPLQGIDLWRSLLDAEGRGWLRLSLADLDEAPRRLELLETWAMIAPTLHADATNRSGPIQTEQLLARATSVYATLLPEPAASVA